MTTQPSLLTRCQISANKLVSSDPTELNNIKLICLSVLKGHKRLTREMLEVQKQVDEIRETSSVAAESIAAAARQQLQTSDITKILHSHSTSLVKEIKEQQQKIARTQLIALEMKEQAMRSSVRQMERRVMLYPGRTRVVCCDLLMDLRLSLSLSTRLRRTGA